MKSPFLTVVISLPISSIIPITSWPSFEESRSSKPRYDHKSDPQTQVRNTLIITSSSFSIFGIGLSTIFISPALTNSAYFIYKIYLFNTLT